jgi:tRNA(adenine34) deaminase
VQELKWADVAPVWQRAFELAWETYQERSNPIAALIVNSSGRIIATGKSAVRGDVSNVILRRCEIAHAEINALMRLDNRRHDKEQAAGYTLYCTLEPCPLCLSALYMSDVKSLHYAAADAYAGSVNLLGSTPYFSRKQRHVTGPIAGLAEVSIFLNVYADLTHRNLNPETDPVHDAFARDYPEAVGIARATGPSDALALNDMDTLADAFPVIVEALRGWVSGNG